MDLNKTLQVYAAGGTLRYHTNPQGVHQTVAAHTWGVTALLHLYHPAPSTALLRAATFHDAGERGGPGDIPYTAKQRFPALRAASHEAEAERLRELGLEQCCEAALPEDDHRWLKWADMAELALHNLALWEDYGYPVAAKLLDTALGVLAGFAGLSAGTDDFLAELKARREK